MNPYEEIERSIVEAHSLEEGATALARLLAGGFSVWTDGSLYHVRELVAKVNGLRIRVFAREHPPPHFHVAGSNLDATFSIADCALIEGPIDSRNRRLVEWWYKRSRPLLVRAWNRTRPTDCPVGPLEE